MRIERVREASLDVVEAFGRLVPQLSSTASVPDAASIERMASSENTVLLVARSDEDGIVGILTLIVFDIPTGTTAWIEDVVVDGEARQGGVGTALVEEALGHAEIAGARTVDLTSRPERVEARRLYERLGFERRETDVYRRAIG